MLLYLFTDNFVDLAACMDTDGCFKNVLYKRPMDHIAHMRKQCKAINKNFIIVLVRRLKHPRTISFLISEWSLFVKPFTQECFVPILVEVRPVVLEKNIF